MTDDELNARLTAAGDRWRTANTATAHVDLDALDVIEISPALTMRPRRTRWIAAVVAAAVVVIAAAAVALIPKARRDAASTQRASDLIGTSWTLAEVSTLHGTNAAYQRATLSFTADTISGGDGCNGFSGKVAISDNTFMIFATNSTLAQCPLSAAIGWIFQGAVHWSIKHDELTISKSGAGSLTYERVGAILLPVDAMAGTWQLGLAQRIDGSTTKTETSGSDRLVIDAGGHFALTRMCGTTVGMFDVRGSGADVSVVQQEEHSCPRSDIQAGDAVAEMVLTGPVTLSVDATMLTVTKPGTGVISFNRVSNSSWPVGYWYPNTLNGASVHLAGPVVLRADGYTVRYFCRIETGTLAHSGQQLTFTDGGNAQTVPCASGASAADQRERAILSGTVTWTLAGNRLTLTRAGVGTLALTFD